MTGNKPHSEAASAVLPDEDQSPFPSLDPEPGSEDIAAAPIYTALPVAPELAAGLDFVLEVPVRLSVELGRTEIPIRDIVSVGRGSIIELDGAPGAPLEVRVNGVLIGRGEVVVINEERLGLRFVEVVSQADRLNRLK